jgi:hypothetical protein
MERAELEGLLAAVPGWTLPEQRWAAITAALDALLTALPGDPAEADRLAGRLRLAAPKRIRTRLGSAPRVPAPPEVRERVNRLVLALASRPADGRRSEADGRPGG